MSKDALSVQVGGSHYKDMAIQPTEFCLVNNLNTCQANIIKYVCRYKNKDGVKDLEKAFHYCDLWIDLSKKHTLPLVAYSHVYKISCSEFLEKNNLNDDIQHIVFFVCVSPSVEHLRCVQGLINTMIKSYERGPAQAVVS